MRISELRKRFEKDLQAEFPPTEITSFFNILSEEYLGMKRVDIALNPAYEISTEKIALFESALSRLRQYEPIQYIIGKTQFFGRDFRVNKHVLIPRPETEELLSWILSENEDAAAPYRILDIGTGSGCIPVSLKKEFKNAEVTSMDISAKALELARQNAQLHNAEVNFRQQDILATSSLEATYDIIVSNPPYVRKLEKQEMHRNVLDHEPGLALYVEDNDALIFYRKITSLAVKALNPGGSLFFEINQYLGDETKELVEKFGFEAHLKKDIFGNYRMLKAIKRTTDE